MDFTMNAYFTKLSSRIALLLVTTSPFFMHSLSAAPKQIKDPVFSQATIIGKVFFDLNMNGYLDNDEAGIQGIRIVTVTGLVMETDGYGRFHIPDGKIHNTSFGQNQLLKVDVHSLPQDAQLTTENPRLIRSSNVGLNKINFGVVFQ